MGGFFGVVSKKDCVQKLFYGTDYHSHLGTRRGGLATLDEDHFNRFIHDITNAQFRSKFEDDILRMKGMTGIGVISDYEDQPLIIGSHLGRYAIATVGVVKNDNILAKKAFVKRGIHFSEMCGNEINPTELIATLINQEESFETGIKNAQDQIEGSCSILLLTEDGIYASRDRLGRTPVIIGKGPDGYAATMESCAFPNLGYTVEKDLGPGETVLLTPEGIEQKNPPGSQMQICSFLWIYYGYPASSYEGINVEGTRYRCGAALAENDNVEVDYVSGIPDSGVAHALGYAARANITYCRPFVKYTPTWPRSFMPQKQKIRDLVAKMKLIPIREWTEGKRILKFLNFSRSRSELDLAARKAISELEGQKEANVDEYTNESSDKHNAMISKIGQKMDLTTLKYQKLSNMIRAIGMPKEKLCTFCWTGKG